MALPFYNKCLWLWSLGNEAKMPRRTASVVKCLTRAQSQAVRKSGTQLSFQAHWLYPTVLKNYIRWCTTICHLSLYQLWALSESKLDRECWSRIGSTYRNSPLLVIHRTVLTLVVRLWFFFKKNYRKWRCQLDSNPRPPLSNFSTPWPPLSHVQDFDLSKCLWLNYKYLFLKMFFFSELRRFGPKPSQAAFFFFENWDFERRRGAELSKAAAPLWLKESRLSLAWLVL